jgi:dihydroxy-acid dehydratase
LVSSKELTQRYNNEVKRGDTAFTPVERKRKIPASLQLYAAHVSSADKGAIRILKTEIKK